MLLLINQLAIFTSSCAAISLGGRSDHVAAVNTLGGILTTVTIRTIAIQWTGSQGGAQRIAH